MPWLIWRYMVRELGWSVLLTTAILVTVTSFGATIKPLADDSLLSAGQTAKYLFLVIVPMLQFSLPFAAGFAATIVLHRLVSDNEILAMAAGGISYERILAPIAAFGAALFLVMILLTQWVIPRFWGMMEDTIASDVTQLFRSSIERGEPFGTGDLQIFADRIQVVEAPADTGADTRLQLWKLVAGKIGPNGRLEADFTATQAAVDIHRGAQGAYLNLVMLEPVSYNRETGELASFPDATVRRYPLPLNLRDEPAAMTRGELVRLMHVPEAFDQVRQAMDLVAEALLEFEARAVIGRRLAALGEVRLDEASDPDTWYVIRDALVSDEMLRGRPVSVTCHEGGAARWRAEAPLVTLRTAPEDLQQPGTLVLGLEAPSVVDLQSGSPPTTRAPISIPNLVLDDFEPPDATSASGEELYRRALAVDRPTPRLRGATAKLERELRQVVRIARGNLLQRYALSVAAPLILIVGTVLALRLRESLPLTVYLWAFLPSIASLIVIPAGRHMMKHGNPLAEPVMWSGSVALAAMAVVVFLQIRRH